MTSINDARDLLHPTEHYIVGYAQGVDQVVRQHELLERFPMVSVTHHRWPSWEFSAVWYSNAKRHEIRAGELRDLLDQLDDRLTEGGTDRIED